MEYVKNHPEVSFYEVSVKMEGLSVPAARHEYLHFPAKPCIYSKRCWWVFEVLIDIFGFFNPEEEMLTLTSNQRWKIWPNSDFKLN
jgi:hypothetical protein